jgi:hypothetical protein
VTTTVSRFAAQFAPCGKSHDGESVTTTDLQGLMTEDRLYSCGCRTTKEEFHDGSVHHMVVNHHGKVLLDEEFRGE